MVSIIKILNINNASDILIIDIRSIFLSVLGCMIEKKTNQR
jgi:hypothetical protein